MEGQKHPFEVGVACRPLRGQSVSGDAHVVAPFPRGVLVAAIDGLGHGREANLAACAAVDTMLEFAGQDVVSIVQRCHERLRQTRGAVMSVASFDSSDSTMSWLSVGNVEGYIIRADITVRDRPCILLRGGVVGQSLPLLRPQKIGLGRGDTLVLGTDGVKSAFSTALDSSTPPQKMADLIIANFARETDDALALVVRWLGCST